MVHAATRFYLWDCYIYDFIVCVYFFLLFICDWIGITKSQMIILANKTTVFPKVKVPVVNLTGLALSR